MTQPQFERDAPNLVRAVFALGHADASLSFLRLLPAELGDRVTAVLALKLLAALWSQYRIDSGINHGRTLLSFDNGYEHRIFTRLIEEFADWEPLRTANALIRANAPALSPDERLVYEAEIDVRRDLLAEVRKQTMRLPADLDPLRQARLLIERCQKLEVLGEFGVCWALNLASALDFRVLGASKTAAPFPALFSREMLRFDRSSAWRDSALRAALVGSAQVVSRAVFGSFAGLSAFESAFTGLRSNSRLGAAFGYVLGIGELTPALLARLVECSEPGARKMLQQLVGGGFLTHRGQSASFSVIENYHLAAPGAVWLGSFSIAEAAGGFDRFDA
jgi:hypothetical protein